MEPHTLHGPSSRFTIELVAALATASLSGLSHAFLSSHSTFVRWKTVHSVAFLPLLAFFFSSVLIGTFYSPDRVVFHVNGLWKQFSITNVQIFLHNLIANHYFCCHYVARSFSPFSEASGESATSDTDFDTVFLSDSRARIRHSLLSRYHTNQVTPSVATLTHISAIMPLWKRGASVAG